MDIDPGDLEDISTTGLLRRLVENVVKSEQEAAIKETRSGKQSVVKIFIADNKGIRPGNLHNAIEEYIESDDIRKNEEDFFNRKVISEKRINGSLSWVEITTPGVDRTDSFIFYYRDGYIWVLTTVVRKWTKKTIEKVLDYLPDVERLYISSNDLEDIVSDLEDLGKTTVSGFTAEYRSQHRDRDATLRFHGAEPEDLDTAKREFHATPSRIEFNQANSPAAAIQDSVSNDGLITVESVLENSEDQAVETALRIINNYEGSYHDSFEVVHSPEREQLEQGFKIDGHTAIELKDPDVGSGDDLFHELEREILSKHQYNYGTWGDDAFIVLDNHHDEIFEVAIESSNIILYPRESTTALSLRTFYNHIYDEFNTTYSVKKHEVPVSSK